MDMRFSKNCPRAMHMNLKCHIILGVEDVQAQIRMVEAV